MFIDINCCLSDPSNYIWCGFNFKFINPTLLFVNDYNNPSYYYINCYKTNDLFNLKISNNNLECSEPLFVKKLLEFSQELSKIRDQLMRLREDHHKQFQARVKSHEFTPGNNAGGSVSSSCQ